MTANAARVCKAIISSSLVGNTQAEVRLPARLMRGPPSVLALSSSLHLTRAPRLCECPPLAFCALP